MGKHIGSCKRCGKQTEYKYPSWVRDYCSYSCSNASKWETRPRAKAVTLACATCRSDFTLLESQLRSRQAAGNTVRYCGPACAGAAKAKPELYAAVKCSMCGAGVRRRVDRIGKSVYCGRECASAGQATPGSKWSEAMPNKQARAAYMRDYVQRNKDRHNERSRQWAKNNRHYRNFIQQVRRASGQITMAEWLAVFDRCGHACVACGSKERLQVDHVVAVAVGGRTEAGNLQLLCGPCNLSKGVKPFREWMLWRHGIEVLETKG